MQSVQLPAKGEVSSEAKGTLTAKGCSGSTNEVKSMCGAAETQLENEMKKANMSVSQFNCNAHFCQGRNLCNAGVGVAPVSVSLTALCLLLLGVGRM